MKIRKLTTIVVAQFLLLFSLPFTHSVLAATHGHKAKTEHHRTRIHKTQKNQAVTTPIDINSSDATTLARLKGIGPKKAEAIVAYRQKNGPFKSVDDLTNVRGIGAKFIARLLKNNPGMIEANSHS